MRVRVRVGIVTQDVEDFEITLSQNKILTAFIRGRSVYLLPYGFYMPESAGAKYLRLRTVKYGQLIKLTDYLAIKKPTRHSLLTYANSRHITLSPFKEYLEMLEAK